MPRNDYKAIEGAPDACKGSWIFDTMVVEQPYLHVNLGPVEQRPLAEGYEGLANTLDSPVEGGLGWGNEEERNWLNKMTQTAITTRSPGTAAKYHPSARNAIVSLGQQAEDLIRQARGVYEDYDQRTVLPRRDDGMAKPGGESLHLTDDEMVVYIDPDKLTFGMQGLSAEREKVRENQRARIEKAMALLWCALYGRAQSMAWWNNKVEWQKRQTPGPGGTLAAAPPPADTTGSLGWAPGAGEPDGAPGEGLPEGEEPPDGGEPPPLPDADEDKAGAGAAIAAVAGIGLLALLLTRK